MNICENLDSRQNETERRPADEGLRAQDEQVNMPKSREERRRYFDANFKYGSTTVLKHNGEFFFRGDIRHCGTDNIFSNARRIKSMMESNGQTMGHMNYNDPPTFSSQFEWETVRRKNEDLPG